MNKYASGSRFRVTIDPKLDEKSEVGFSKVSGLNVELEVEEIQEGGVNGAPHVLPAPVKRGGKLTLEKGLTSANSWAAKLRPGFQLGGWLTVEVEDSSGAVIRTFMIEDGLVTKWELTDMDASSSQVLIEKLEIAHEGLKCR